MKKSLGQHFLLNPSTIEKILRLARVGPQDRILEIGPGLGVMTERLSAQAKQVIAVEKDRTLAAGLQKKLAPLQNTTIVEADFLTVDLEKLLGGGKWKVVANLPYNVATEILFHLLERNLFFDSFYLMVQKEVALRLAAQPGSKAYGILSIFSQLLSQNRIVMTLPPGAFTPPPKVDSALVEFKVEEALRFDVHRLPLFESVVQAAFSQRRKMIRNGLKNLAGVEPTQLDAALDAAKIAPQARAEQVSIAQFADLANFLAIS